MCLGSHDTCSVQYMVPVTGKTVNWQLQLFECISPPINRVTNVGPSNQAFVTPGLQPNCRPVCVPVPACPGNVSQV